MFQHSKNLQQLFLYPNLNVVKIWECFAKSYEVGDCPYPLQLAIVRPVNRKLFLTHPSNYNPETITS